MKKLIFVGFCLLSLVGVSDTLYWQVTDAATVDGRSIYSFVESYGTYNDVLEDGTPYVGYNVGARVKITGGNLSQPEYLNIYLGNGWFEDGSVGVEFSPDTGGYWGIGNPSAIQSSIEEYGWRSELFQEYSFMVELGELTWDDVAENLDWTTIAQSDEFAADQLSQYIHERFDIAPPNLATWNPLIYHTTPEPNSLLLMLFGTGLLLLKRKQL